MEIEISTHDTHAVFQLLDRNRVTRPAAMEIAPGVEVEYKGTLIRKSMGFPEIATFVLSVGSGVALNVVASAIWDWLKGLRTPLQTLRIDRQEIEFDEGEIKRIVTERIEHKRGR